MSYSSNTDAPIIRVRLTRAGRYWLVACAGLAVVGILKNINLILLISYFLFSLLFINWWIVRRVLTKITSTLDPCADGFAGDRRMIHCTVANDGRKKIRGTQVGITVAGQTCSWYLPQLDSKESVDLARAMTFSHRGIVLAGEVQLRNSYPFGLVEACTRVCDPRTFANYPRRGCIELSRLISQLSNETIPHSSHRTAVRQLTEGTDIHGLRPFRPGDSPRWIHWRTTARVGELMVREFDRATGPRLSVVIVPPERDTLSVEPTLELAGTLVWEWARRQDGRLKLWFPFVGQWVSMNLDHRRRTDDILRRLAALSKEDLYSNEPLPTAIELQNRTRIVYITSARADAGHAPKIMGAIQIDPTVASAAYRPPVASS